MFQSRNRETFDSNVSNQLPFLLPMLGFNLVIEKLLIPTLEEYHWWQQLIGEFQSRNRETFDSNQWCYQGV